MLVKFQILFLGLLISAIGVVNAQRFERSLHCDCLLRIDKLNPKLDGLFVRKCEGILVERGRFAEGVKDGVWITYSIKGNLIRRMQYKNGVIDGRVELFYPNGKSKLNAEFDMGKKTGKWEYYNDNGKVILTGSYKDNVPVDIWKIFDSKGKSVKTEYDYTTGFYTKQEEVQFHKDRDIIQNDNSEGWYVLKYPIRTNYTTTAPLGGFLMASDIFVDLVEIPIDFWDTFISYKYKATFTVSAEDNSSSFELAKIDEMMSDKTPTFPFLIITSTEVELSEVKHSDFANQLLDFKIQEALLFMPPWIFNQKSEVEVYIPYVLNMI